MMHLNYIQFNCIITEYMKNCIATRQALIYCKYKTFLSNSNNLVCKKQLGVHIKFYAYTTHI